MRKIILYVNLTFDGFLAGPQGELDWMLPDPGMNLELSEALRAQVDTMLLGRNAYLGFEQNFQAEATDPASPPELVDFARWMLDTPKMVLSRTLTEVSEVSRLATGTLPDEVAALKSAPGKDIVVFGGVGIVQELVRLGLVDEYWIKLYPVAIGDGKPLFTDATSRANLTLTQSQAYESGILALRYV
jgi:dihydrofolate reductase